MRVPIRGPNPRRFSGPRLPPGAREDLERYDRPLLIPFLMIPANQIGCVWGSGAGGAISGGPIRRSQTKPTAAMSRLPTATP